MSEFSRSARSLHKSSEVVVSTAIEAIKGYANMSDQEFLASKHNLLTDFLGIVEGFKLSNDTLLLMANSLEELDKHE